VNGEARVFGKSRVFERFAALVEDGAAIAAVYAGEAAIGALSGVGSRLFGVHLLRLR
jgi:hypothetical protein